MPPMGLTRKLATERCWVCSMRIAARPRNVREDGHYSPKACMPGRALENGRPFLYLGMFRPALVDESHLRGSAHPSRHRNPTAMGGQSHSAHHALPVQAVYHRYPDGTTPVPSRTAGWAPRCLVCKTAIHVFRHDRLGVPMAMEPRIFFHLAQGTRHDKNPSPPGRVLYRLVCASPTSVLRPGTFLTCRH